MKLLVLADIDDIRWRGGAGQADALVSCGDVCDQLIVQAAEAYGCRRIFAIKGNHDLISPFPAPIYDLHLCTVVWEGIRFGGFNGSWKYKPRGPYLYGQDVFVSHNSPRGIHDRADGIHVGFDGLVEYIHRHKPKVLVHGHQHVIAETEINGTRVIGVYGQRIIEIS